MSIEHIANSWRDEEYREGLDETTQSQLPESPVGEIDLRDVDLDEIKGGTLGALTGTVTLATACWCVTFENTVCC